MPGVINFLGRLEMVVDGEVVREGGGTFLNNWDVFVVAWFVCVCVVCVVWAFVN